MAFLRGHLEAIKMEEVVGFRTGAAIREPVEEKCDVGA
jgi:hypothetical protein